MMSQSNRERVIGDYKIGRQLGSGSFSIVWHGRHRVHGTEVAIKEILMERLNKKLRESLVSEIVILKRIDHPNIIGLYDIIENPRKIYLVLEYCKGGDLYMYIHRHERVPEATAKSFMQQLASGLQILRANNVIHRDLKPQNLLLSTKDNSSVLKIADFGFARSLQPRGLAETLCGSPLYMAPEIMQFQKYDAKADLWSVGVILFQLVTGQTPFTGNTQIQLLQNILKSTELQFQPDSSHLSSDCRDLCQRLLRRNPVERLTFGEFFNHPFLFLTQDDESLRSRISLRTSESFKLSKCYLPTNMDEIFAEDSFPFPLDDDSSGPDRSPSYVRWKSSTQVNLGELASNHEESILAHESFGLKHKSQKSMDRGPLIDQSRVSDSLDLIDQEYVFVSGPPMDTSSLFASASKPSHLQCIDGSSPLSLYMNVTSSEPMSILSARVDKTCFGSPESQSSVPSGISQVSIDIADALEQPSGHYMPRIQALQQCSSAINELVTEKIEADRKLDAFSIQLVILAIWKQALHICHTQAASAMEGSPSQESISKNDCVDLVNTRVPENVYTQIETEFFLQVEQAEELASIIEPGSTEMPDAMEIIFQSALSFGKQGAVDELMGNVENAECLYSKAVRLLIFLVEAPSLILNPPFLLTKSDRYRLRRYIDILNNRQGYSRYRRESSQV